MPCRPRLSIWKAPARCSRAAQNDVVAGNIEAAAKKIALVRANPTAVTQRQLNFVSKLMQARVAELADDEAGSLRGAARSPQAGLVGGRDGGLLAGQSP